MTEQLRRNDERSMYGQRQFSLKSLLALMLLVSLVLVEIVVAPNTQFFKIDPIAIFFVLAPIPLVVAIDRLRLVSPRIMTLASLAFFAISLVIPALGNEQDAERGLKCLMSSFVGVVLCSIGILDGLFNPGPRGHMEFSAGPDSWPMLIICLMGSVANIFFIVGAIAAFCGDAAPKLSAIAWKAALAAFILASLLFVGLKLTLESDFYPGYGLWVTSMLALWLATRRAEI